MLFSNFLAAVAGVVSVVSAASYPIPGTFTGMNGNARPLRRDINDLKTDTFALYVDSGIYMGLIEPHVI